MNTKIYDCIHRLTSRKPISNVRMSRD